MQCLICGNDFDPDLFTCPVCAERGDARGRTAILVGRIEDALLSFFLGAMVILVLLQVVLRYAFQSGITGGDSLVRHLVLWIAFFGATIAARSGAHVRIDALNRILPHRWQQWVTVVTDLFSFGVCALLVYASVLFIQIEYEGDGRLAFMNMAVWIMEIIIPLGYAVLAYRFGHRAVSAIFYGRRGKTT